MNIGFHEIKTPSQMRKKDYIRLASKILFVKSMHDFYPFCGNCNAAGKLRRLNICIHKKACIGYIVEINKNNNQFQIRWRKDISGICKYYENKKA